MALDVVCKKGHAFIQADVYQNWPEDAPICPVCYTEWKAEQQGLPLGDADGGEHVYPPSPDTMQTSGLPDEILATLEGDGLPRWEEGQRPLRMRGHVLDGSSIITDLRKE